MHKGYTPFFWLGLILLNLIQNIVVINVNKCSLTEFININNKLISYILTVILQLFVVLQNVA